MSFYSKRGWYIICKFCDFRAQIKKNLKTKLIPKPCISFHLISHAQGKRAYSNLFIMQQRQIQTNHIPKQCRCKNLSSEVHESVIFTVSNVRAHFQTLIFTSGLSLIPTTRPLEWLLVSTFLSRIPIFFSFEGEIFKSWGKKRDGYTL